ncbi:ArsR family transcriptional regulator [Agromyces rhizosphaerae]|uniref:ArsR family transcriptional regulator n=1 Tax=Agromyces rhizosphaerae TaxID=88374 RepID=A0A9W6CTJ0_9MICO|nr:winged helix-turn-helix domain-containing protein [Agromyces rhizosphaerae]GLI26067.1 ArsR family transcriptional regulator [Agromyces rhizosphaerae]
MIGKSQSADAAEADARAAAPPADPAGPDDEALAHARAKALASPLRLRILRICLHEPHTNREIAERLGLNPGTCLHHVRTLVATGFLRRADDDERPAREVPYLATRLSWRQPLPGGSRVLVEAFLEEIAGLDDDDLDLARLGLRLAPAEVDEFQRRMNDLLQEFAARPSAPDGEAVSVFVAVHPDRANQG